MDRNELKKVNTYLRNLLSLEGVASRRLGSKEMADKALKDLFEEYALTKSKSLITEKEELQKENNNLLQEIKMLKDKNKNLNEKIHYILDKNIALWSTNRKLEIDNEKISKENKELSKSNEILSIPWYHRILDRW